MDEYNILFKYGIEVGILGAFLWAFKKILSSVLDDKTAMMEMIGNNTEAFHEVKETMHEVKDAVKDSCITLKTFRDEAITAISGFQEKHENLTARDEEMLELLKGLNGKEKGQ